MSLVVKKFGGTSVANCKKIKDVANTIHRYIQATQDNVIVVVSAMAGSTNDLVTKCREISSLSTSEAMLCYDAVLTSGETISAGLLSLALNELGIKSKPLYAWQIPIYSSNQHGSAFITQIKTDLISSLVDRECVPVIAGFQAITTSNNLTTIGRGGGDITAALIAAATKADRCDIYTDVDGVYNADPRIIPKAKKINILSVEHMVELSVAGAKVLHIRSVLASLRYNFQMRVLDSEATDDHVNAGTLIVKKNLSMEQRVVKAIASNKNLLKLDIVHCTPIMIDLFSKFKENNIDISHINTNGKNYTSIITTLDFKQNCELILNNLKDLKILSEYSISSTIAMITVIGYSMNYDAKINCEIVEIFSKHLIPIYSMEISATYIKILIDEKDNKKASDLLYNFLQL